MQAMKGIIALILLFVGVIIANDSLFIVDQHEQVVVVRFGKFIKAINEPGLNYKTPFVESAIFYDKRLLAHDIQPTDIVTKDKRTLVVDNFAKWRIVDVEKFYKRARTYEAAKDRLRDIIFSELRIDFGGLDLFEIVSTHRAELMKKVTERSNEKVKELDLGVEIVDVRIKRADLPEANLESVFRRMRSERERIAKQFRSEGEEEALKIRATTDKEKAIMFAEAYRQEQELRGEGDAIAIKITADAYGKDMKFYEFIRSLQAYDIAMTGKDTVVITQDSPFFQFMK
jgi:membrane protease subunit HflC